VFLLLLCNDRAVLGPWTNGPRLNALASLIIGVLVALSAILTATVLFPSIDVTSLAEGLFAALAVGLAASGLYVARDRRQLHRITLLDRPDPDRDTPNGIPREEWTMPPLDLLERPLWSRTRRVGMLTLRGYLIVSAVMLVVKAVELAGGH
jgi:hypothetical protein